MQVEEPITGTNTMNTVREENTAVVPTLKLEEGFLKSNSDLKDIWKLAKFLRGEQKRE